MNRKIYAGNIHVARARSRSVRSLGSQTVQDATSEYDIH